MTGFQTCALPILAGLLAAVGAGFAGPVARWRPALRRSILGIGVALPLAAFVVTLAWTGEDNDVRLLLTTRGQWSGTAYNAFKAVADVDRDGQLPWMGEGDCDFFDPGRHSGAPETPNNGIDEDCDGQDLELPREGEIQPRRWDYPMPEGSRKPYNVILVTVDAVSPALMTLEAEGQPDTTPFLRSLARQSVFFPWAYSQGPSTRLAIPAMMTSRYDSQIQREVAARIPLKLQEGNLMFAEILKKAGYRTAAVFPVPFFRNWKGIDQGFDSVNMEPADFYKAPLNHNADKVTQAALAELRNRGSQPIFLWVHYYDTHGPYTKPPDGTDFGDSEAQIYQAELLYTDRELQRFVGQLDQVLPPEDTLLIVTGDHGESFDTQHKGRRHGFDLHSQVLHMPLMIRAPFVQPHVVDMPMTSMDLLPTIVNVLGIPGEFDFEGNSLVPVLLGQPPDPRHLVFHMFYLPENVYHKRRTVQQVGVRSSSVYLIHDLTNNTFQAYRYRTDEFEAENVLGQMPEVETMLRKELARFLARVTRSPGAAPPAVFGVPPPAQP